MTRVFECLILAIVITALLSCSSSDSTIQSAGTGSVTLSWTAPTTNSDGSPLADLAGYRFYWGTTPGIYPNVVTVSNPGISIYVIDNLAPGTYDFVATSLNSTGDESEYSNVTTQIVL